jgi:hypothetical protein
MTGIPFDSTNFLIELKLDNEYLLVDGKCWCWRCVISPEQLEEWEKIDHKEFGDRFESRWQSASHYYRATDFHTGPYRSDQSG